MTLACIQLSNDTHILELNLAAQRLLKQAALDYCQMTLAQALFEGAEQTARDQFKKLKRASSQFPRDIWIADEEGELLHCDAWIESAIDHHQLYLIAIEDEHFGLSESRRLANLADQSGQALALFNESLRLAYANETLNSYMAVHDFSDDGYSLVLPPPHILLQAKASELSRSVVELENLVLQWDFKPVIHHDELWLQAQASDITSERETQKRLRQLRQEAEIAHQNKSAYLASMSHEIRNPMNGIMGFASLLAETELDESQSEYVTQIRNSAQSLLVLVNDILDFEKIQSGQVQLQINEFDLHLLLSETVGSFAAQAITKNVGLYLDIAAEVPTHIKSDAPRLRQILTNLLSNAIKFTSRGQVILRVCFDQPVLRFQIIDSGIGIPEDRLQAIFIPYVQAEVDTTQKFGGTGLGLPICKQLAELVNATIQVRSTYGQGTEFTLDLPCNETPIVCDSLDLQVHLDFENTTLDSIWRSYFQTLGARILDARQSIDIQHCWCFSDSEDRLSNHAHCVLVANKAPQLNHSARWLPPWHGPSRWHKLLKNQQLASDNTEHLRRNHVQLRVLVAEDNPVNQLLAVRMLNKLHCMVDTAGNGEVAVEQALTHDYDCILMDLHMPLLDGFEASERILRSKPHQRIIALSGDNGEIERQQALEIGINDFLTKPITLNQLSEALNLG